MSTVANLIRFDAISAADPGDITTPNIFTISTALGRPLGHLLLSWVFPFHCAVGIGLAFSSKATTQWHRDNTPARGSPALFSRQLNPTTAFCHLRGAAHT